MEPKDSLSLSGSVAVVTGGGRGIGHAIVQQAGGYGRHGGPDRP